MKYNNTNRPDTVKLTHLQVNRVAWVAEIKSKLKLWSNSTMKPKIDGIFSFNIPSWFVFLFVDQWKWTRKTSIFCVAVDWFESIMKIWTKWMNVSVKILKMCLRNRTTCQKPPFDDLNKQFQNVFFKETNNIYTRKSHHQALNFTFQAFYHCPWFCRLISSLSCVFFADEARFVTYFTGIHMRTLSINDMLMSDRCKHVTSHILLTQRKMNVRDNAQKSKCILNCSTNRNLHTNNVTTLIILFARKWNSELILTRSYL